MLEAKGVYMCALIPIYVYIVANHSIILQQ